MTELGSLQAFFLSLTSDSSSHFDRIISRFLKLGTPASQDVLEEDDWNEPHLSEEKVVKNWKSLLAFNVFYDLSESSPKELVAKVRLFERHPWNQNSQYLRSLIALNHALVNLPIPEVGTHLLESGAALIDLHEYSPWLSLPYTPEHYEFGIFLSLLALRFKKEDLKEAVLRLAHWQINTLDAEGIPLPGLFVREEEGKILQRLCLSYLFFRCAALLSLQGIYSAIAEATIKRIGKHIDKNNDTIDPLWPLIEKMLDQYNSIAPAPMLELSEQIHDPSTALVGCRSPGHHILCTLHGGHTGFGELKSEDIQIVTYGPQYLPLGECRGFGIEGNALTDHGMRRSVIEWRRHSFILRGCTRMVDQPLLGDESAKFRGIWLEAVQEYIKPHFYLKTTFLGLDGWDSVVFSFFVKAPLCKVLSQTMFPRTLNRYKGEVHPIILEGQKEILEIRALSSFQGNMEVIPLAGGNDFWGADFLVAYHLSDHQRQYQWHIGPPSTNAHKVEVKS